MRFASKAPFSMDDLLRDFLAETGENLDLVDTQLVRFEQEPDNIRILENIFRLVHTIKGTCGFIGLPRLEALTHAAETLMANFRTGAPVTRDAVSLILATLDRIKGLLQPPRTTTPSRTPTTPSRTATIRISSLVSSRWRLRLKLP